MRVIKTGYFFFNCFIYPAGYAGKYIHLLIVLLCEPIVLSFIGMQHTDHGITLMQGCCCFPYCMVIGKYYWYPYGQLYDQGLINIGAVFRSAKLKLIAYLCFY